MKHLIAIFVALTMYGIAIHQYGGAVISACMIVVVYYGARQLDKRDQEWLRDPRSATPIKDADTLQVLKDKESEAARSTF
jgi:hypothetical protein